MTEEEAKTKDCCGPSPCGVTVAGRRVCIGSGRMAWRVREAQVERRNTGLGQVPVEPLERYKREGWRQIDRPNRHDDGLFYERTVSPESGYCGLAGPPP